MNAEKKLEKTWDPGEVHALGNLSDKCKKIIEERKLIKSYTYGEYNDVILDKYAGGCATVFYAPTGVTFYFDDWDTAFAFARGRAAHANYASRILS